MDEPTNKQCPREEWIFALNEMAYHSHRIATIKGWHRDKLTIPHVVGMVVSELSEMMEVARQKDKRDVHARELMAEECADAIIRLLDFAYEEELPVGDMLFNKMIKNEKRSYRHGNKPF